MTLPSSDSYSTYGGDIVDYSVVEDPDTDLAADASNQCRASAAGMTATCFRAVVTFIWDGSTGLTLLNVNSVWDGVASLDPVLTRLTVGTYRIVFPAAVTDLRGNTQSLNLLGGIANPDVSNSNGYFCTVHKVDLITFDVYVISAVDAALEDLAAPINLMVR